MSSRRGAAYGIAGLVKGSGIKSLSSYDIIRNLTDAAEEKDAIKRESVSVAFETLSRSLGKYFEPYVLEILPIILKSLGDPIPEVRMATDNAAKEIMKNTTSFGVKKLIPLAISILMKLPGDRKRGQLSCSGQWRIWTPRSCRHRCQSLSHKLLVCLMIPTRKLEKLLLRHCRDLVRLSVIQKSRPLCPTLSMLLVTQPSILMRH